MSVITHWWYVALAVFNTLPWARSEVIEVPLDEGLPTMKQYSAFGRTGYAIGKWIYEIQCMKKLSKKTTFVVENVPPLGVRGHNFTEETEYEPVKVTTDRNNNIVMENVYIRATFDKSGHLIGLTDKKLKYVYLKLCVLNAVFTIIIISSRPLIRPNERGNVFRMFEDIVSTFSLVKCSQQKANIISHSLCFGMVSFEYGMLDKVSN